ncbi:MAG: fibrobacter succinogenes major paralogous domain-containing protein [Prevotellaceae bacterium]|jgi:hypothetical protein|nr:fibrobacter succinogenes major paralogous domain-containing protein [Prevotellaceae bacterium]
MRKIILTIATAIIAFATASAQVGINTETPAATLDVVAGDGSTAKGIIAPRMTLAQLNADRTKYTAAQTAAEVYITDATGATIAGYSDQITCTGFAYWNGAHWVGNCVVAKTFAAVTQQPKAFTFYEEGMETPVPLTFGAGGSSTMNYQWYKISGGNVHVRIAQKCVEDTDGTGVASANFTPDVIKGTTRNANNTGFFRYYCVAKNLTGDSVISNIAEVAVGCGAKNKEGEWFSFMCFNLGATQMTIAAQRNTALTIGTNNASDGLHAYVTGEEQKYGDLYQWGRIRDGHEQRGSTYFTAGSNAPGTNQRTYSTTWPPTYASGNIIGTSSQRYPHIQISDTSVYFGKFIITVAGQDYNWANPAIGRVGTNITATSVTQGTIDQLWRLGRFTPNDPCAKIKDDGITYETFYPGTDGIGGAATTAWKTPSQGEWGEIYRGGELNGSPDNALSNTWTWHYSNGQGYDIKPDGATITLHLPASGYRSATNGRLYNQGANGSYWSTTYTSINAHNLYFYRNIIDPAFVSYRGYGHSLRCIRAM